MKKVLAFIMTLCMVLGLSSVGVWADDEATWKTVASMNSARRSAPTQIIDGKIYVIGGNVNSSCTNTVEAYDPTLNVWNKKASMNQARAGFAAVLLNGKVYAIGGYNGGNTYLSSVEVYDPNTDTWTIRASMPTARAHFQTQVIGDKIYVIGGQAFNGSNYPALSTVEVYDTTSDSWTALKSMSTGRKYFATALINNKIYAFGGSSSSDYYGQATPLSSTEMYDPLANTWSSKASMSIARRSPRCETVNGTIYVFGGATATTSGYTSLVEKYDPETDGWTKMTPMPVAKITFIAAHNGMIYSVGGTYENGAASSCEVYNISSNTWSTMPSLSSANDSCSLNIIYGKLFAIGGPVTNTLSSVFSYAIDSLPNIPVSLTATASNSKVDLSWGAVSGATSYTVKRSTTAGGPYTTIKEGLTDTTYTDTDVTNGTTYYYVVTAVNSTGESTNSNEASATPQEGSGGETGSKALLVITMTNGLEKEYELSVTEINKFIDWYDGKAAGNGQGYYKINKNFNLGPFVTRTDYLTFDKIQNFEVMQYN